MAKKYKVWIHDGNKTGWVYLDENDTAYYVDYDTATVFKKRQLNDFLKESNDRGVYRVSIHRYRSKEKRKNVNE